MHTCRTLTPTLILAATVVAGCAGAPLNSSVAEATSEFTDLRALWGKLLSPYRLIARFPPDQSTRPGDIFVVCHNEHRTAKEAFPAERIGNLFRKDLNGGAGDAGYPVPLRAPKSTRFFPASVDKSGKLENARSSGNLHSDRPIASFPALVRELGDAKNFGISLPTGSGLWGFGSSSERKLYYTLSIPVAEIEEVPRMDLYREIKGVSESARERWEEAKSIQKEFAGQYETKGDCEEVRLVVVHRTYATRHFTMSYTAGSAGAIGGQMQMALGKERSKVVEALAAYGADTDGQQSGAQPDEPVTAAKSKDAEITRLRQALLAKNLALDLGFAGARGESASVSEAGVSLNYTFDVPVVFAVGAIWGGELDRLVLPLSDPTSDSDVARDGKEGSTRGGGGVPDPVGPLTKPKPDSKI